MWDVLSAAEAGDAPALRRLLEREPNLYRAEYWYTPPLHFAVREGHLEAVRVLLDAGADPGHIGHSGDTLVTIARDRGHEPVARLLEQTPSRSSAPPEPIDAVLWKDHDLQAARRIVGAGAPIDLTIAAALGDLARVTALLDGDPRRIGGSRPSGRRPLSAAAEFGHEAIVVLLLDRGADPNAPEGAEAPRGRALHAVARAGNRALVERLLDRGADPNATIDSAGSATYAARTPELRALLLARGGRLDPYDLVFLDEDDEAVRRVAANLESADAGCGGVLAAACTLGKRDLVVRLLDAGARVPPVLTACRSYLLSDPITLRLLLASGMDPDLPNWLRATPLHDLCGRDNRGRPSPHREHCAAILLDAGATLTARDEDYRSTPLAWAARNGLPDMVAMLLARGASGRLPDDAPWATPLAWATRRGHAAIAESLRTAGATT